MVSVIVNQELARILADLDDQTEIRDRDGRLVGIFTPESAASSNVPYPEARAYFDQPEVRRQTERSRELSDAGCELNTLFDHLNSQERR